MLVRVLKIYQEAFPILIKQQSERFLTDGGLEKRTAAHISRGETVKEGARGKDFETKIVRTTVRG